MCRRRYKSEFKGLKYAGQEAQFWKRKTKLTGWFTLVNSQKFLILIPHT